MKLESEKNHRTPCHTLRGNYNLSLSEGDIVPCYLDYKSQDKFEGYCILIEKKSSGPTFFMDNEEVYINLANVPDIGLSSLTGHGNKALRTTLYIDSYLKKRKNKSIRELTKRIKPLVNRTLQSYNNVYNELEKIKCEYPAPNLVANIFMLDTRTIALYFMQKYTVFWRPTLFREERWVVQFYPQERFNTPFTTCRRIAIISAVAPRDEDIPKMTEDDIDHDIDM